MILQAFSTVFRHGRYVTLALLVALTMLLLILWLPNLSLLNFTLTYPGLSITSRLEILWAYLGFFRTGFTAANRVLMLGVALLAGVNLAMLMYHLRQRFRAARAIGAAIFSSLIGVIGVGCASCGSVVLASVVGLAATVGFLSLLPFRSAELGVIGLLLQVISIVVVARGIAKPYACST